MDTYVIRIFRRDDETDTLVGTVEKCGDEAVVFRNAAELTGFLAGELPIDTGGALHHRSGE